jgi:D-alanyl-D-alanine carboxypeptidase (penicillin-binding protein 5/6)
MRRWMWLLIVLVFAGGARADELPRPPPLPLSAFLLLDYDSGMVLAAHDADKTIAPASLTKLMTAYVLFEQLKAGRWALTDSVPISARASGMKGARIFLRVGTRERAEDLLQGMLVRSANDATVALVEHVAGDEAAFVAQMNDRARALGLTATVFVNATGLDQAGHRSTAADLTRLARALMRDFPEHYPRFATREFALHDLKQYNRNALLWRDPTVDGVKTGQTKDAGYCLIASAKRGAMRLIATVLGAPDDPGRVTSSQQLLDYGFRHFESRLWLPAQTPTAQARVWLGAASQLPLGLTQPLYLALPRGAHARLKPRVDVEDVLTAPIRTGQAVGRLLVDLDERTVAEMPLVALQAVDTGSLLQQALDRIQLWWQ